MTRLADVFDIFLHLPSLGKAQADGSAHITTINKRHVIQRVAPWDQPNNSQLVKAPLQVVGIRVTHLQRCNKWGHSLHTRALRRKSVLFDCLSTL